MKIKELMELSRIHGRTIYDDDMEALFCNWSCSGLTVRFEGKKLAIRIKAMSDQIPGMPGMPTPPPDWPCIGAVVNDELIFRKECHEEDEWIVLYEQEEAKDVEVRIVKVSENARGKLAILEIDTDGRFLKAEEKKCPHIEILGDSITCGFGNEAENNGMIFRTSEENGWQAYGAIAARQLGYEFDLICESGICAVKPEHPMFEMHAMEDIYAYTDKLYADKMDKEAQKWDFKKNHNDVVVISLGTNDSNPIRFYRDFDEITRMEEWFHLRYKEFVKMVRELNGEETYICCALGSMDYYLYHHIRDIVKEIKEETGDERIRCFEFIPINVMFEGYGAMGHPSAKTHARMGKELAAFIGKWMKEEKC